MIRAITFDLDDTLWAIGPVIDKAERILHDWLQQHYPRIPDRFDPAALRNLRDEVEQSLPHLAHDVGALRRAGLQRAAQQCGYDAGMVEPAFSVLWEARNQVEFFADVLPVLEGLAEDYVLGAITNGNADLQRVGLDHLFRFSIRAVEIGCAKPDRALFEAAATEAGCSAEAMVHVGDDLHADVFGARQAGMRGVWVNRQGQSRSRELEVDAEVRTLADIPGLISRWSREP
ncbi:MAG: HAD-IA family hydrolase [Gammaproteobacteria bacterium]|nr:HAD-IA family hydrolase [Gammaproteobacteria bacterium]